MNLLNRNVWAVLRIVILLIWLGFSIQLFANYLAQTNLQLVSAERLAQEDVGPGWYRVQDGLMDYPHAVGQMNEQQGDDGGHADVDYTSYVPYLDPASGKPILVISITDKGALPSALRHTSQIPIKEEIVGTVTGYGCDDDVVRMFSASGYHLPKQTSMLAMLDTPPSLPGTLATIIGLGFFVSLLFAIGAERLRIERRPVNLD
jgi:hypothetical protein